MGRFELTGDLDGAFDGLMIRVQVVDFKRLLGGVFLGLLFCGCAQPGQAPGPVRSTSFPSVEAGEATGSGLQKARTGIATGWGREVASEVDYTRFTRAGKKPVGVSMIRYNDEEGAKEMGVSGWEKGKTMQKAAGGLVEWGVVSRWGGFKDRWWRGERFVIGKKGRSYSLMVRNLTTARLEVILSVDGLDVLDGKAASFRKRGYIMEPREVLTVRGFRTSESSVASFRFSTVSGSYSNLRHGTTKNVGVIGLAVYPERGAEPGSELRRRKAASAFAERGY